MPDHPLARFRATVHYDGTAFRGWQLQPDERTVQRVLEDVLARLLAAPTRVHAAGRTDTGVHAVGQEIAFDAPDRWDAPDLCRGLNALAPPDVWVEQLSRADADFHPRFDATARRYEYLVGTRPQAASPLWRDRLWAVCRPLDQPRLLAATARLEGERCFAAFAKAGQPERGTRCRVETAAWSRTAAYDLCFTIVADRFLHRMVRYLVGTLVEVASGQREAGDIERLLAAEGAEGAARPPSPAPAHGLYLTGVRYPEGWNRTPGVPGYSERGACPLSST